MRDVVEIHHLGSIVICHSWNSANAYLEKHGLKFGNVMPGGAYTIYRDGSEGFAKVFSKQVKVTLN